MADYGLLSGLAQGLSSGVAAYNSTAERVSKEQEMVDDKVREAEYRNQMYKLALAQSHMQTDGTGNVSLDAMGRENQAIDRVEKLAKIQESIGSDPNNPLGAYLGKQVPGLIPSKPAAPQGLVAAPSAPLPPQEIADPNKFQTPITGEGLLRTPKGQADAPQAKGLVQPQQKAEASNPFYSPGFVSKKRAASGEQIFKHAETANKTMLSNKEYIEGTKRVEESDLAKQTLELAKTNPISYGSKAVEMAKAIVGSARLNEREIEALGGSRALIDRGEQFIQELSQGTITETNYQAYKQLLDVMGKAAVVRKQKAIDSVVKPFHVRMRKLPGNEDYSYDDAYQDVVGETPGNAERNTQSASFPMQLRNPKFPGKIAPVKTPQELAEAQAEGWQ